MKNNKYQKTILLNPGPTNVSPGVRGALQTCDICHREPEFSKVFSSVRKNILKVVNGKETHTAIPFISSATGCNEAVISSIHGKILLINNGKYSKRLKKIADKYYIPQIELKFNSFKEINLRLIEDRLRIDKDITHIIMVHHETSTGMLAPLREIGCLAKKYKKILFADTVSSVGGYVVDARLDNLSFFTVSANKCLESFPGISFVIANKKELIKLKGKSRSFYFDLYNQWEFACKGQTPFTPAVQLFFALDKALKELLKETVNNRVKRYKKMQQIIRLELKKMGFCFLLPDRLQSNILTAIKLPINMDYWKVHDMLKNKGYTIYTGQSNLDEGIFRIAALGHITNGDIIKFIEDLKDIFKQINFKPRYK